MLLAVTPDGKNHVSNFCTCSSVGPISAMPCVGALAEVSSAGIISCSAAGAEAIPSRVTRHRNTCRGAEHLSILQPRQFVAVAALEFPIQFNIGQQECLLVMISFERQPQRPANDAPPAIATNHVLERGVLDAAILHLKFHRHPVVGWLQLGQFDASFDSAPQRFQVLGQNSFGIVLSERQKSVRPLGQRGALFSLWPRSPLAMLTRPRNPKPAASAWFTIPKSSQTSSVRGVIPSALQCGDRWRSRSINRQRTPWRSSSAAIINPTGPAPTDEDFAFRFHTRSVLRFGDEFVPARKYHQP